jgi:hypothetical protein
MNDHLIRATWPVSIVILLTVGRRAIAEVHDKLPVPDAKAHAAAVKLVQDIYQEELANARSTEQKLALAVMLLADGLNTKDDATGRYVLLEMARDIAAANGDIETTLRAIDQSAITYNIDSLAVKAEALDALSRTVRSREQHTGLVSTISELVAEAIAADRYDLAKKLSALALVSARKARDIPVIRQAASQVTDVEALEKEHAAVAAAKEKLENSPADPDTNLAVGRFLCFVKGDWEAGIPMLVLGNDQALKGLAERELADPTTPEEQVSLGDEWWTIAQTQEGRIKSNLLTHAQTWYEEALPKLSGLTAARVRRRLAAFTTPDPTDFRLPVGSVVAFDFEKHSIKMRDATKVLRDLTANGNDGTVVNAKVVAGMSGTALHFQGDGYVTFSDSALPTDNSPRSVLCWMRFDKIAGDTVPFAFGSLREDDATYLILFGEDRSNDRAPRKLYIGNFGGHNEESGQFKVDDQKWHHFALVYDGNGNLSTFVDGQLDHSFRRNCRTALSGEAVIGNNLDRGAPFHGAIDDFIILDRAVSADEIGAIKDGGLRAARPKAGLRSNSNSSHRPRDTH